jgi:heat shock protein 4
LNINPQVAINVECLMDDYDLNSMVTRDQFVDMIKGELEKVTPTVQECLNQAGSDGSDLNTIEILGSGMRSAVVQQTISAFLKRDLSSTTNAEEAIAKGLALQAAMLSPKFKVKEYGVTDIQPYSISVYWQTIDDPADTKENSVELFKTRSAIPAPKNVTFNRPDSKPFQVQARYTPQEGVAAPQSYPLIGTFTVKNVPKPKLANEIPEVRVKVVLNADGIVVGESAEFAEKYEEAEADPAATPAPAATPEANGPADKMDTDPTTPAAEAPKKMKKKVRYVPIPLDVKYTAGLSDAQIKDYLKVEDALQADVAATVAVQDARNALEAYIFKSRNKLHAEWTDYVAAKDRDAFGLQLEDAENWTYDEGDYQTRETFEKKLLELKAVGEPIATRLFEAENRPKAITNLRDTLTALEDKATKALPEYEHIDAAEKQKIVDEVNKTRKWLDESLARQSGLAKTDDPVLFSREITLKAELLQAIATPILSKPKPQPKPAPAPAKEEAKPAQKEDKMDVDKEEKAQSQAENNMDVDQ